MNMNLLFTILPFAIVLYCGYSIHKTIQRYKSEKPTKEQKKLRIAYEISSTALGLTILSFIIQHIQINNVTNALATITVASCMYTAYCAYRQNNRNILIGTMRIALALTLAYIMCIFLAE